MTTATSPATPGTHTPTPEHEYVVCVAGAPVVRGTHAACAEFAAVFMTVGCSVMSAQEHAHVWPEAAIVPYASEMDWLTHVLMGAFGRTWHDSSHTPGIRELTQAGA